MAVYQRQVTQRMAATVAKPGHWVRAIDDGHENRAKWQFESLEDRDTRAFCPVARAHLRLAWARTSLALAEQEWFCCEDLVGAVAIMIKVPPIVQVTVVKAELKGQLAHILQNKAADKCAGTTTAIEAVLQSPGRRGSGVGRRLLRRRWPPPGYDQRHSSRHCFN